MAKYRLNIRFRDEDLEIIAKAQQKVVLVKHTVGSSDASVAWVSFKPWQKNTVDWMNQFAIYSSSSEVMNGATISKLADKSATAGVEYKFADGYFHAPVVSVDGKENTYMARNCADDFPAITMGLAQNVVVNGQAFANNPINAVYVPFGQRVVMTPVEKIDVYLKNDIVDSTVISHIQSIALPVTYKENESEHFIAYNGKTGEFFLES